MILITLHKENHLISLLIKLQTRSAYSHAGIIIDNYLYEARAVSGVTKTHLSKADLSNVDIYKVKRDVKEALVHRYLEMQLGKGYDYRAILRFLTRVPAYKNNRYFCSELVYEAIEIGGVKLLNNIRAAEVSPKLLSLTPFIQKLTDEEKKKLQTGI